MAITTHCPGCQTRFELADDLAGKRIKCKSCGDIFRLPQPAPAKKARDDDDRRTGRYSRPVDDDDRRTGRYRKPVEEEDDDRPARSRRREDDSDDELPRRRDDEDAAPRKKTSKALLIALPLALVGFVGLAVVIAVLALGGKKGGAPAAGDVVAAPSRTCPLEVPEKDVGTLVLPDNGTTFGLLRNPDAPRPNWIFEPYDVTAKRRVGKVELTGVNEPKVASLSPDGKQLLVTELTNTHASGDQWLRLWSLADGKQVTTEKWVPFPRDDKRPFDAPALYRAEFVANDRILTLGTNRTFYIYQLPTFEPSVGSVPAADKEGLGRNTDGSIENPTRYQRQMAFTADHKRMAVWTGELFIIVNTADGVETSRTTSVKRLAQDLWRGDAALDRAQPGPVAFSPDGNTLAAVITHDWAGSKKHALALWDAREMKEPTVYPVANNQFHDAPAIYWWGNRFIVTHGSKVDGMLIDVRTGLARRQLMGPLYGKYGFTRDGKLWYAAGEERKKPATVYVVDSLDPDLLTEGDDYEQIRELSEEFFLRRLWLEPGGVLRNPTRDDPPIKQRLIRRP